MQRGGHDLRVGVAISNAFGDAVLNAHVGENGRRKLPQAQARPLSRGHEGDVAVVLAAEDIVNEHWYKLTSIMLWHAMRDAAAMASLELCPLPKP